MLHTYTYIHPHSTQPLQTAAAATHTGKQHTQHPPHPTQTGTPITAEGGEASAGAPVAVAVSVIETSQLLCITIAL